MKKAKYFCLLGFLILLNITTNIKPNTWQKNLSYLGIVSGIVSTYVGYSECSIEICKDKGCTKQLDIAGSPLKGKILLFGGISLSLCSICSLCHMYSK